MKTTIVALAMCIASFTSSTATIPGCRVTTDKVVEISVETTDPSSFGDDGSFKAINSVARAMSFDLIVDDLTQIYQVWVSDKPNGSVWYAVKMLKDGVGSVQSKVVNGENVISFSLPVPFLPLSSFESTGFVKISVLPPQVGVSPENIVEPKSWVPFEEYSILTFDSELDTEYLIEGADLNSVHWIPVDTYDGQRVQTLTVSSQGDVTTVNLANPLLPWLPLNGGCIRISKIPSQTYRNSPKAVIAEQGPQTFVLVATDCSPKLPNPILSAKRIGINGRLTLSLYHEGPDKGSVGKYFEVSYRGKASLYGKENLIPVSGDPPEKPKTKKVYVSLTSYSGTSTPLVYYEPAGDTLSSALNDISLFLSTDQGSCFVATRYDGVKPWEQARPFIHTTFSATRVGNAFEWKNVERGVERNDGITTVLAYYNFTPMTVSQATDFVAKLNLPKP